MVCVLLHGCLYVLDLFLAKLGQAISIKDGNAVDVLGDIYKHDLSKDLRTHREKVGRKNIFKGD